MRITKKLLLGLLAALSIAAAFAPASQANFCVGHSSDPSFVCSRYHPLNSGSHGLVDVCDKQADGRSAYSRVVYHGGVYPHEWGKYYYVTGYDKNGSTAGCTTYDLGYSYPGGTDSYIVATCVQSEGCGQWGDPNGNRWYTNLPHAYWSYSISEYQPL